MRGTLDYRLLFRDTPTPLLVLDPQLVIAEVNEAYLAATMRTRQDLVGRPVFEAFPDNPADPGGAAMLKASLSRVLRSHVTDVMAVQKYDIPQPGGGFETRWWAPVNAPVLDEDGTLCAILHRVEDLTDYVLAQQKGTRQMEAEVFARHRLQREHDTLQMLADSLERNARIKDCELAVAGLTAGTRSADDVLAAVVRAIGIRLGWQVVELWTVDRVARILRRAACWTTEPPGSPAAPAEVLPPGMGLPGRAWQAGEPIWEPALARGGPLRAALAVPMPAAAEPLGVLVCYSDTGEVAPEIRQGILTGISAQLGGYLERRRAETLAAELDSTRREYVALAGHELRTPLTSIQAYTDLILEDPELSDEQRGLVRVVQRNATTLAGLVAKLLDVAGLRSGHIDVHRRPVDLAEVVRAAVVAARDRAGSRVRVAVDTPPAVPVEGDARRLRQVLDELLANALTWAADDSVVDVTLRADAHAAVLSVANIGARIDPEERDRLFELFFRGATARHGGPRGSGLGLTLARAIVEQHGGTIGVSEPGEEATVFTVHLPVRTP